MLDNNLIDKYFICRTIKTVNNLCIEVATKISS